MDFEYHVKAIDLDKNLYEQPTRVLPCATEVSNTRVAERLQLQEDVIKIALQTQKTRNDKFIQSHPIQPITSYANK